MCMEDIKIGRNLSSQFKVVIVPTAAQTVVCSPDPSRVCIVFSGQGLSVVHFSPVGMNSSLTSGISATASSPVVRIHIDDYGSLVTQGWQATAITSSNNVSVVTSSLAARKSSDLV